MTGHGEAETQQPAPRTPAAAVQTRAVLLLLPPTPRDLQDEIKTEIEIPAFCVSGELRTARRSSYASKKATARGPFFVSGTNFRMRGAAVL